VHVADEAHHDFRRGEGLRHAEALHRLALIELLVGHRHRVHVVQRLVAVDDVDGLADADARDVRRVLAALLIQHDRGRRHVERVPGIETVLHVHERVLDAAGRADKRGLTRRRRA
jgi:hypothetical protein